MRDARVEETMATLKAAGYRPWLETGKHKKIKWQARDGKVHMLVLSCTPKNYTASRNHNRKILRRLMAS